MALIGFGTQTGHPRVGVPMLNDDALGDLRLTGDPSAFLEGLFHKTQEEGRGFARANLEVCRGQWNDDPSGLGFDLPHSLVITPTSEPNCTYHVTHSESIGLTVDIHDSWESAQLAQEALCSAGGGGLLLHGCYSTDGVSAFRLRERIESPQFLRADDLSDVAGVREWLDGSLHASADAIIGLLIPELHPDALVSYSMIAALTGLKLQTLRTYVHRAEGSDIPFRQFSTEQGHPQWSRPVMAEWAGYRVNPRYSIDCRPFDGVVRAEQVGERHPHIDVGDYTHEGAKQAVEASKSATAATGFLVVQMPKGFRIQDHNGEVPFDDLNPEDFEGLHYSMQISEVQSGPVEWP